MRLPKERGKASLAIAAGLFAALFFNYLIWDAFGITEITQVMFEMVAWMGIFACVWAGVCIILKDFEDNGSPAK